jgi:hypothetical protein
MLVADAHLDDGHQTERVVSLYNAPWRSSPEARLAVGFDVAASQLDPKPPPKCGVCLDGKPLSNTEGEKCWQHLTAAAVGPWWHP